MEGQLLTMLEWERKKVLDLVKSLLVLKDTLVMFIQIQINKEILICFWGYIFLLKTRNLFGIRLMIMSLILFKITRNKNLKLSKEKDGGFNTLRNTKTSCLLNFRNN